MSEGYSQYWGRDQDPNLESDFVFRSDDYGLLPAQNSGRGKEIEFSNNPTSHGL